MAGLFFAFPSANAEIVYVSTNHICSFSSEKSVVQTTMQETLLVTDFKLVFSPLKIAYWHYKCNEEASLLDNNLPLYFCIQF